MSDGYDDPLEPPREPEHEPLFVPKSNPGLGWTINLNHPYGWLVLIAVLALAAAPIVFSYWVIRTHLPGNG